ncbi:MAG: serine/threonine-protein kinase [Myxococcota bacterium]
MGSQAIGNGNLAGVVLGEKYRLVRLIGRGAIGEVYEAEHAQLGRRYAVKVLQQGAASSRSRQRFLREARVLARLEHENIVSLIDAGDDASVGEYLVLEYIRGSTLRSALPSLQTGAPQRVLEIVRQLACGLGHAHAAGVVHRDLKPENVMLTSHADGRLLVKILDFGIARLFDADEELITRSGAAMGTAAYMSPEQARGDRDIDCRVDVYALGVIVYEAFGAARPLEGDSYNETIFRILNHKHVPLAQLRPDLPAGLCAAVERALTKDRANRFAAVEDFARALGPLEPMGTSATLEFETNEHAAIEMQARVAAARSASGAPTLANASRWRKLWLVLGAAVLFALGAAFQRLWQDAPRPSASQNIPLPPVARLEPAVEAARVQPHASAGRAEVEAMPEIASAAVPTSAPSGSAVPRRPPLPPPRRVVPSTGVRDRGF